MLDPADYDQVIVAVAHPFGNVPAPLTEWLRLGPGPRPYVEIISAWRRRTGEPVPLDEIPLEYHNSARSRRLQRLGRLPAPWGPPPAAEPEDDFPLDLTPEEERESREHRERTVREMLFDPDD
ncbi:hypothetical protein BJY16_004347 [Actinoplanes octamycinicus]|uniref:Uncharacterized protein n=1 Tax=Actinoplanes octamycinicus TaxID=135948 RepID=A0A7W7GYY2_9ACTN|nr:hypothetical protein [Actinoplanes octamycinicus]MBB4740888.1 hypothetical protein [Actinoplanes octamycinicus]GIE55795.1 hypothetical protein Aoc01nite_11970 [Actinoplanes octamycinicus]